MSLFKNIGLKILRLFPDQWAVSLLFRRKFGRFPNFKEPQTFNEKINWRKLYQRDPRFITFADKLTVKDEIARIIGEQHIIPTLWSGDDARQIPYDDLTPPYVIKTNHGCGDAIFVSDNAEIDQGGIANQINSINKKKYGVERREWAYQHIKPKILVEKMLITENRSPPDDYKFFVYGGKVHFVQYDTGRAGRHEMAFFDRAWSKLPVTKAHPQIAGDVPKPPHYDLMIQIAEKIGDLFDFVRVDLYDLPTGVFFGETTFYPAGGLGPFRPKEWDSTFGEFWMISKN